VPQPKHTVCDQSLALLSAIVQCFTQYSSLRDYLTVCAELLKERIAVDSHWIPRCFVRIDVAHFVKLASKWIPLKNITRLAKEMVLRTVGLLIKSKSLLEMRLLLLSLFVLFINETNGADKETGEETPCEQYKNILTEATSTGFVDIQKQFDDIIGVSETEDEARINIEKEYERQNEGLDTFENPFQTWANDIFNESKNYVREGTGINPFYCPELVSIIFKVTKLISLWSAVMVPIFGYGEEFSSSAAVESSFKKLKTVTMRHINLPTTLEIFLENHIQSLKGSSLLRSAHNRISPISPVRNTLSTISEVSEDNNKISTNDVTELNTVHRYDWSDKSDDPADSDQLLVNDEMIRRIMNKKVTSISSVCNTLSTISEVSERNKINTDDVTELNAVHIDNWSDRSDDSADSSKLLFNDEIMNKKDSKIMKCPISPATTGK